MNLQRLAILLDRADLREKAKTIIEVFAAGLARSPFQHERFLCGIEAWHEGFEEIAVVGAADAPETRNLLRAIYGLYLPNKVVARLDPADKETPTRVALLAQKTIIDGKATAYVCRSFTCSQPTTDPAELSEQLRTKATSLEG